MHPRDWLRPVPQFFREPASPVTTNRPPQSVEPPPIAATPRRTIIAPGRRGGASRVAFARFRVLAWRRGRRARRRARGRRAPAVRVPRPDQARDLFVGPHPPPPHPHPPP